MLKILIKKNITRGVLLHVETHNITYRQSGDDGYAWDMCTTESSFINKTNVVY